MLSIESKTNKTKGTGIVKLIIDRNSNIKYGNSIMQSNTSSDTLQKRWSVKYDPQCETQLLLYSREIIIGKKGNEVIEKIEDGHNPKELISGLKEAVEKFNNECSNKR